MEEHSEALISYLESKNSLLQQIKELEDMNEQAPERCHPSRNRPSGKRDITTLTQENAGELSFESTKALMVWFMEHIHSPYPTVEEKEELARQTGK